MGGRISGTAFPDAVVIFGWCGRAVLAVTLWAVSVALIFIIELLTTTTGLSNAPGVATLGRWWWATPWRNLSIGIPPVIAFLFWIAVVYWRWRQGP